MVRGPRDENVLPTGVRSPIRPSNVNLRRRIPRRFVDFTFAHIPPTVVQIQTCSEPAGATRGNRDSYKLHKRLQQLRLNVPTDECCSHMTEKTFLSVFIWFQEWVHVGPESNLPIYSHFRPFITQLFLVFCAIVFP